MVQEAVGHRRGEEKSMEARPWLNWWRWGMGFKEETVEGSVVARWVCSANRDLYPSLSLRQPSPTQLWHVPRLFQRIPEGDEISCFCESPFFFHFGLKLAGTADFSPGRVQWSGFSQVKSQVPCYSLFKNCTGNFLHHTISESVLFNTLNDNESMLVPISWECIASFRRRLTMTFSPSLKQVV